MGFGDGYIADQKCPSCDSKSLRMLISNITGDGETKQCDLECPECQTVLLWKWWDHSLIVKP